ncbi:MAG: alpha/beta hydrolase [Acidobacteria bacterium]|nr:alpha/beta hydrolase [Acidobacteriota bacterium]
MFPNFQRHLVFAAACAILIGLITGSHSTGAKTTSRNDSSKAQSRFAKLDGMRVHYENTGKGDEALVFVHGWTCDLNFWRMQTPVFAKNVRVIAIDLPGHGRSDKPRVAYTMDLFARSLDAVLRDAKVKRAVLVGHSMGTPVARQFYRKYPEKTLALVAVDGALRPFAARAAMEPFIAPLRGENYKEVLGRMFDGMLGAQMPVARREEIKAASFSTPQYVAVSAMEGMADDSIWTKDQIKVPVLAILAHSPFWPADNEKLFREIAPDLEYKMLDGVGHFLMMDKPDEFNRALADFLARRHLLRQK